MRLKLDGRLIAWHESLPSSIKVNPGMHALPHVITLHIACEVNR